MNIQKNIFQKINEAEKNKSLCECIVLCRRAILLPELLETEELFKVKVKLANLLIETNDAINNEEALEILNSLLTTLTKPKTSEKLAFISLALGYAYYQRIKGEKSINIKKSINHYVQALQFFTKNNWPQEWALTNAGIGKAYSELSSKETDIVKAVEYYFNTLTVYTKDKYPDDYKDSIKELGILKKRLNNNKLWNIIMDKL